MSKNFNRTEKVFFKSFSNIAKLIYIKTIEIRFFTG